MWVEKLCCSVAGLQIAVDARAKKTLCCSVTGLGIVVADEICERKMLGDSVPGLQDAMLLGRWFVDLHMTETCLSSLRLVASNR